MEAFTSPKRLSARDPGGGTLYDYYAGYSSQFVREVIRHFDLGTDDLLLDPWNGAGTTTKVASDLGVHCWGGDANPAMVVVAKARLLAGLISPSELSLCDAIIDSARSQRHKALAADPLAAWFSPGATEILRSIERAISQILDTNHPLGPPAIPTRVSSLSPLAAFFYLALFRTVRQLVSPFIASNPTWVKRPSGEDGKLSLNRRDVSSLFKRQVERMSGVLQSDFQGTRSVADAEQPGTSGRARVAVADSKCLPLTSEAMSAALSSPPYCTRIDYAVATAPELAILGVSMLEFDELRGAMIGTSTISQEAVGLEFTWGPTCAGFLASVATHYSKASSGYYLRTHLQYFAGLAQSLRELDRVLRPGSPCVLVVQDSFYKEVHNNLPSIVTEMAGALGWHSYHRRDYRTARSMARVNSRIRPYRTHSHVTESALFFRTAL